MDKIANIVSYPLNCRQRGICCKSKILYISSIGPFYFYQIIQIVLQMLQVNQYPQQNMDPYGGQQLQNINLTQVNMMPYDPNMPPPPMNPNAFMACNEGISNGFGAMFFNIRDPGFTQKNVPIKQEASYHISVIVVSFILIGGIIVGAVGFMNFLDIGGTIGIILGTYFLYVLFAICCSDIRSYVSNMKKFGEYAGTYQKMRNGRGFFRFWIECYHYVTVRTKNGTSRRKVVTHTANQIFTATQCVDESGELQSILEFKEFVFIHYLKRYYFTDDASQNRFIATFNYFVHRNTRDAYQNYSHTFDVDGFEEFTAYSSMGDSKSCVMFYIFTLLGLALPYSCIFERYISRYDVGILKRLTV